MTGLNGGELRHRVTLQQKQDTQDPVTGEIVTAWADVADLWAHVRPKSAKQLMEAQALQSRATVDIKIRYRTGIDHSMRIVHRGMYYNIEGIVQDQISGLEWMTLPCSEGVNEG